MSISITIPDELALLLGKVYKIEAECERMTEWKMYMSFPGELRDLVFTLAHDSEQHKQALIKMYEKFLNIDIAKFVTEDDESLSINGLTQEEVVKKILQYDTLALDIYSKLNSYTSESLLDKVFVFGTSEEYFKTMSWLVEEEKRHVGLLNDFLANK